MDREITYQFIRAVVDSCECRGKCDCWIRAYVQREEARRREFQPLHLVPDCGSLVQSRERDDELSEMAVYVRNIRAMWEGGEIDWGKDRPKLVLVHSD